MTDSSKNLNFNFSHENRNSDQENKTSDISKNLEPFVNFSYFNEVNTFNECLGGYEDFTNTYHSINKKLEDLEGFGGVEGVFFTSFVLQ